MFKKNKEIIFILPSLCIALLLFLGISNNKNIFPKLENINPLEEKTIKADEIDDKEDELDEDMQDEEDDEKVEEESKASEKQEVKGNTFKDGEYEGVAKGYDGNIVVSVIIKNGKIDNIIVKDHSGETPAFYDKACVLVEKIISKQSTNVDVVSGATFSSNGIINAVIDALNKACVDDSMVIEKKDNDEKVNTNDNQKDNKSKTNKDKKVKKQGELIDGVYEGSSICDVFNYVVNLKIKVKKKKVVAIYGLKITDNEDEENMKYVNMAWKKTVKKLLKNTDGNVDVVSGATYSSNAIIDAYLDAYNKAVGSKKDKIDKNKKNKKEKEDTEKKDDINNDNEKVVSGKVKDGTYHVSTECTPDERNAFAVYTLSCDVIFKDGKLYNMTNFTSDDESNRPYYLKACNGNKKMAGVVSQLIEKQSATKISAVSGATCSSKSVRRLYILAYNQAVGSNAKDDIDDNMETEPKKDNGEKPKDNNGDENKDNGNEQEGENIYLGVKDKTVRVSVNVYPDEWEDFEEYVLTCDVTFENERLKNIEVIEVEDETNLFYCMKSLTGMGDSKGLLEQFMLFDNTSDVVSVSGATCSSVAFKEVVKKAVVEAKK